MTRAADMRTNWQRLALLLVGCALLLRMAVPAGWMPSVENGSLTLRLCGGWAQSLPPKPQMHHGGGGAHHEAAAPSHHGQHEEQGQADTSQPCAFAAAGLAWASAGGGEALALPLPAALLSPSSLLNVAVGRGLAAPPPPSTGPPAIL